MKGFLLAFSAGCLIFESRAGPESLHTDATDRTHELGRIEKELDAKRAHMEALLRREKSAFKEFLDLEERLQLTRRLISGLASKETATERKLRSEAKSLEEIGSKLSCQREHSRRILRTIYKHGRPVTQSMIWGENSPVDLMSRIKFTRMILVEDHKLAKGIEGQKVHLEQNNQNLGESMVQLSRLARAKTEEQRAYRSELREKERLLKSIKSEKKLSAGAIEELQKREAEIRQALGELQEEGTQRYADKAEVGGWFETQKGRLPWPVEGKVVFVFGEERHPLFRTKIDRSGIEIEAKAGTGVVAVAEGRVTYLSRLRGYGNLLILEHGNDYYTLYANLSEISLWPGAEVRRLQEIGVVGEGEAGASPCLHFEIRKGRQALDPLEWLK